MNFHLPDLLAKDLRMFGEKLVLDLSFYAQINFHMQKPH